jgi:putative selenate reductase
MATLIPAPFADLVDRMRLEFARENALFHLPRRRWWTPDPDGPDLSVSFHGRPAGTPVGPAAGPHTQMAQNLVLSWLAGGRIMELKTVQINDRLSIGRPCIDMANVGYNIEWSQELRIGQAAEQYAAGAMLIHMLIHGDLLPDSPITSHATETIFDTSIGYDLAGIRSAPVRSFIEQMRDAAPIVERLRRQIPRRLARLRDLDYPTKLSSSITLSTFHGCPADEIERICEFLLGEMDYDVVVKMNPPMLGRQRLEHLLHDVLGYDQLQVPPDAYRSGLTFDQGVDVCGRLASYAKARGRRFGVKFSNTLEVENHRDVFPPDHKTQYLSGQPLHVLSLTLAEAFRRAVGPDMPITFSAGVDRSNVADMVACGFCPVTVCTDLLRPGGYGRLPGALGVLAAAMKKVGASNIDGFILNARAEDDRAAPPQAMEHDAVARAAARNLSAIAAEAQADPRYRADRNADVPKRIDSQLDTFDCLTCDKCLPVCPNAANFLFTTDAQSITFHDWVVSGPDLVPGKARTICIHETRQIATFADFCNDCGNCDTFCPEHGGPFIKKPNFFGTLAAWQDAPRDGFFINTTVGKPKIHGRIGAATYTLATDPRTAGHRFEDGTVSLILRADDHGVERWSALTDPTPSGHTVNMHAYHTMRILLASLLRLDRIHQVNVGHAAAPR